MNADSFSVRWTGFIAPLYSETYTFYSKSDNGRRVWINNQLVIDKWLIIGTVPIPERLRSRQRAVPHKGGVF